MQVKKKKKREHTPSSFVRLSISSLLSPVTTEGANASTITISAAMIDQAPREQIIRNHEVPIMWSPNRIAGFNFYGAAGICTAIKSERDLFSCGIPDSDSVLNPHGYVLPFNEGYIKAISLSVPDAPVYFPQAFSFHTYPAHTLKQGIISQRNWDYMMPPGSSLQNVPFKLQPQGNAPELQLPFKLHPQGNTQELQLQDFQYFVVIDFEATCDVGTRLSPQEIIEFPSILVNGMTGRMEGHFHTYIKPVYHPILTDFCKELTGIQQSQVLGGVSLSEALLMHDNWLEERGVKNTNFAVVTWSDWDCKVMLESECNLKGIRKPNYFNRWINLKLPFYDSFGQLRCNLKGAVEFAGLIWEGRAHSGLDDAKNTARLLLDLMRRGIKLTITNSMLYASANGSTLPLPIQEPPKTGVSRGLLSQGSGQSLDSGPWLNTTDVEKDPAALCFCGVPSNKCVVKKPGPRRGKTFFGCGNWSVTRGAACQFFEWAVPDIPLNA